MVLLFGACGGPEPTAEHEVDNAEESREGRDVEVSDAPRGDGEERAEDGPGDDGPGEDGPGDEGLGGPERDAPLRGGGGGETRWGGFTYRGSYDPAAFSRVLEDHEPAILACAGEQGRGVAGEVRFEFRIVDDGAVEGVETSGEIADSIFATCVTRALATWVFPEPPSGAVPTVYSLRLPLRERW